MNVPGEFLQAYNQVLPALEKLKKKSNMLLQGVAHSAGGRLVEARIKPIESVLLKTERDGLAKPFSEMDDLLAATIVVKNEKGIPKVEEEAGKIFRTVRDVPRKTSRPEEFIYDDRHLILALIQDAGNADPELDNLPFELQIKTEMRAAASTVTRELDYKSRWLMWDRRRWASRVRALVETIDELLVRLSEEEIEGEEAPEEDYVSFARRNDVLAVMAKCLGPGEMPDDRRRLAITVDGYLKECSPRVTPAGLGEMLSDARHAAIREASSLTPAQKVFLVLLREGKLLRQAGDASSLVGTRRYLITKEMTELCPELAAVPGDRRVELALKA
jgi:ppGpp synthetase/RelA/SpoT-type nucleotidyltranferase